MSILKRKSNRGIWARVKPIVKLFRKTIQLTLPGNRIWLRYAKLWQAIAQGSDLDSHL